MSGQMRGWRPLGRRLVVIGVSVTVFAATSSAATGQRGQAAGAASVQTTAATKALTVTGAVATPLTLDLAALKAFPRTRVEITEDGRTIVYEGVLVGEVLKRAGTPLGAELRGNAVASYVLASASDGYQALFSLAELDPAFTGSEIIVADSIDGKPLFDYQGPFRIVAPKDRRGARSVRMLERLEVVRLRQ